MMDPRLDHCAGNDQAGACDHDLDALIEHLAGDVYCPLCGERYLREGIQAAQRVDALHAGGTPYESRWTLSMQCHRCGTGSVITAHVAAARYGMTVTGMRVGGELTPMEARLFATAPAVTTDDVLDLHVFLKHFQGDFSGLSR
ncbi:MAG: hypothetical protein M1546_13350 [Chloroflexi bacterium]|nr:hypothetical protein [Chloroflexota bacterium]